MKPTNHSALLRLIQIAVPGPSQSTKTQKLIARRCFADVCLAIHSGGPYQMRRITCIKLGFPVSLFLTD